MGRKKPKEPESATVSDSISVQPDIFTKLFGDAKDAVSIFSDNNPFKRKPQEQEQGQGTSLVKDVGSQEDDISEGLKVRKRSNEEKSSLDSSFVDKGLETPLKAKKLKKEKLQEPNLKNPNVDPELEVTANKSKGENPNVDLEGKGGYDDGMAKKKKMKRKRDELEREYEEKKYGVVENSEDEKSGGNIVGKKRKSLDNPADMMISKEGFDDEGKLLRTVFVGNLPLKVKKKTLVKEFSKFGEVDSVRVRSVPILDTKKPRKGAILEKKINDSADSVHAYIVFKSEPAAQASLSHNMTMVEGHHIRVDRACPPRKKLKGDNAPLFDHRRTVFVGNLPFDVKDEELYQLFCGLKDLESSIEGVRIVRDPHNNLGKGFAYVLFKTREAVNLVIKKRNLKIRDRELRLYHAKPNSTPSKRGNPYADQAISPAKKRVMDTEIANNNKRLNTGGSMSYQGLRASKSGNQKKVASIIKPDRFKLNPQKGEKQRIAKRPAVAAKKAKAKAIADGGGAFKQAGIKRKSDSWTPRSSSHKSKKMKK